MITALVAFPCIALPLRAQDWRENPIPPNHVSVRPVFFVPADQRPPTADQRARLARHLRWAQRRYAELLGAENTFTLDTTMLVVRGRRPLAAYRAQFTGSSDVGAELLDSLKVSRFACPWVFEVVVMNPDDDEPLGAGIPLNGGLNTGGGIVTVSSYSLDRVPYFQSTLQHELAHAFGLPHVDVYGRDMQTDPSMMSYKPAHHTNFFNDALDNGVLVPEDVRALARNHRVFPNLAFDSAASVAAGAVLAPHIVPLGPLILPGHPDAHVVVTTTSGELYGTHAGNVVQGEIRPSAGPGVTFDQTHMWHSDSSASGWVELVLTFPVAVELTRMGIYTEHSGQYHRARRARISVDDPGSETAVTEQDLGGPDAMVTFPRSRGRRWRVALLAGPRGQVTVRGLRFFSGEDEVFEPLVPAR